MIGCRDLTLEDCNLPTWEREGFLQLFEDKETLIGLHPVGAEEKLVVSSVVVNRVDDLSGD